MQKIKIGKEGWLEEGRQEERVEIALRMLETGNMGDEIICQLSGISRSELDKLKLKRKRA